jgi:hypothetical protein
MVHKRDDLNWFRSICQNWELGRGDIISFWIGDIELKFKFSNLYALSFDRDSKICNTGDWRNNVWGWNFHWVRPLEAEEIVQEAELVFHISLA